MLKVEYNFNRRKMTLEIVLDPRNWQDIPPRDGKVNVAQMGIVSNANNVAHLGNNNLPKRVENDAHPGNAPINNKEFKENSKKENVKKTLCEEPRAVSFFLRDQIQKNNPRAVIGDDKIKCWTNTSRRMLDEDGRDPVEIRAVIAWAQNDEYWKIRTMSMDSVRRNYDQLVARMNTTENRMEKHPLNSARNVDWKNENAGDL